MQNNNSINNYVNNFLLFLIFCFPLFIILGSASINVSVTMMCIIILLKYFNEIKLYFLKNSFLVYLFFLFLYISVNQIFKFNGLDLFLKSLGYFRYLIFAIGISIVLENIPQKKISFYVNLNLILIFLVGLDIFYQFFFYENIFGILPGMCDGNQSNCQRFSGVFGKELIAGSFICQIGLLMLFLKSVIKSKNTNLLILISSLFIFNVILISGERNSLLIFFITIFFICFFKKKLVIFMLILSFFLGAIFIWGSKNDVINTRFINFYKGVNIVQNPTIIDKIKENPWSYHFQAATELFLTKPILGHGIKSFRVKCSETNIEKKIINEKDVHRYKDYRACSSHPHNYFLEFLAEQGLIGGVFYIGLIIIVVRSIYKKIKLNKEAFLSLAIGSLILAIIFPFKPSGSFLSTYNASVFFYILGFFMYSLKNIK